MSRIPWLALAFAALSLASSADSQNPQSPAPEPSASNSSQQDTYAQQRDFATQLFNQNHALEALPVFEDLANRNPTDPQVLFGLGASLIQHSATLPDLEMGRQERLRARSLLLQAKELGANGILLNNLLDTLPADGSLRYPGSPEVVAAIQAGETAFAKNNYDEAIAQYSRALELDPQNYSAALFIGDCYFAKKNIPKAAEYYDRAVKINPDLETAYRYQSDMWTKNGDPGKARQLAIKAVVAEPYSQLSWRGLVQWATSNHLQLSRVKIDTHSAISSDDSSSLTITMDPKSSSGSMRVWLVYTGVRASWKKQEFKKRYPLESEYRHTLAEEVDALRTAADTLSKEKPATVSADADLVLLKRLADAEMLEPYVLLSIPDQGIAVDYIAYRDKNRDHLEQYLATFVVPPAPSKN